MSIHITRKNFKGLTKAEIDEQANDPSSELKSWGKKFKLKKEAKQRREKMKGERRLLSDENLNQ